MSTGNLKSRFCGWQGILMRYRASAMAVTTLSLVGCENISHRVLPSQPAVTFQMVEGELLPRTRERRERGIGLMCYCRKEGDQ